MKKINSKNIIISPHCDDAVLSLGGYILSSKKNTVVVDIFGTCAWSKDRNIKNIDKLTVVNQKEEKSAMKKIGAKCIIFDLPEALIRGYSTWNERKIIKSDRFISAQILRILKEIVGTDNNIFFPMGVGNHVDHVIINRQLKVIHNRFIFNNNSIYLYEDIPYVCYGGLIEKLRKLNKEWILKSELINISGNLNKKIKAIKIYKSQIDDENCNIIKEYSRKIKKGRICERIWKIENEK